MTTTTGAGSRTARRTTKRRTTTRRTPRRAARATLFGAALALLTGAALAAPPPATATTTATAASTATATTPLWFDGRAATEVSVTPAGSGDGAGARFTDGYGREVVLRGFNVSGETKLAENGGLPFADAADARASAAALRTLTGGNAVRFLLSWAYAEPEPGVVDTAYLRRATDQIKALRAAGLRVFPDFHQDLHSRYLFDKDSWYTGDGAPRWAVEAGAYPRESCGICVMWGQNITQNQAVKSATRDFWTNRTLTLRDGSTRPVQTAFLDTAQTTMTYLARNLTAEEFAGVVGFDPYNEPYAGEYAAGQDSRAWEREVLWPFYEKFRARMDAAGWRDKPLFAEPNMFWNANLDFARQPGGLLDAGAAGPRYVFNTHFYDQKAISGIFMWGKAEDGQYVNDFTTVRDRAAALGTTGIVSEFGHPLNGLTADKAPTVNKAMYQALDSRLSGASWWANATRSGPVLSSTQWQWDIYSGRHREAMNGNPDKILTEADAWNDEDLSAVRQDASGRAVLRQDARLLDRIYPDAVAGRTVAFTYEDRSRDGATDTTGTTTGTPLTWNRIPATMPETARLVGTGRYGVLAWRSQGPTRAPTQLHLPAGFTPDGTTVISDLGTATGLPAYTAQGETADHPLATAPEQGTTADDPLTTANRLLLTAPPASDTAGTVHYALIAEAPATPELRAAAQRELAAWAAGLA
ncbi:cellulase family glycosylhydrolase [Streptomyces sp. NPDC093085]|uniref:cellulase family glycosylhydrolase n=1 Tax=Streptomyces sp. NPDC093085 TaxID=3155068 RepID=UPI003444F57C